ncbi:MAG: hypothetical protein EBS77_04805, partial [Gammaproteobacteria bacterium]|nr:hypothetical protein [Gammaproteobacteria bacterium]
MSQESVWVYCVGGGVSSLLLAAALARYPVLPGPVVVAEKKSKLGHPQSFGLWVGQTHPLDHLIKAKWPRWRFSLKGETSSVHSGLQQNYALIEGDDFFDWVSQSIESHPQISILLNTELTTPPVARHILDSRPPPLSHFKSCQTFVGYDVATTASGEYDCVDLMADMQMQDDSLVFLYRLPKPNGNILIEWTAFGQRPFDLERLTALVEASIGNARIVRKEQGIIPMGVRKISSWGTPIGTRG